MTGEAGSYRPLDPDALYLSANEWKTAIADRPIHLTSQFPEPESARTVSFDVEPAREAIREVFMRRIVLATNVAETSLTVPGIRYVIDTGVARIKRYSYRNKVEQLQVEKISRASASQRAGRCGRVMSGICFRLYSEQDYLARPEFTDPEILRSSLAAVILRMKSLKIGSIENFPFLEPPLPRMIADGYQLLAELGAVDAAADPRTAGAHGAAAGAARAARR